MTDQDFPPSSEQPARAREIDTSVPQSARVWNYFLGGKDNYPVDRMVAEQAMRVFPQITEIARNDRGFLKRAVRHLAGELGIRQFLDIGTGLPTMDNTHEVAQRVAPESRVVYVDNDPLVLVHAQALLTSTPPGVTDYIEADLRQPDVIVAAAAETLDFDRPVAIMLLGILHYIPDYDEVCTILARLLDAVPSGSYLAVTHSTYDIGDEAVRKANADALAVWNENARVPLTPRSRQQVSGFFDGLELVEPGLVSMSRWRPEDTPFGEPSEVAGFAALARKP
ncbi:SAM-dependent methyltransferase [Sphaerimonospora mesophila]|uniref:SAM-dependent methyltransferase n=1 Tax=Sphaerimonospora mesophila TaxID=37483 RepID=UPI0006E12423